MLRQPPCQQPLSHPEDVYRVYEATDPFHALPFRLAVSLVREACLLDDIDTGRRLVRLGPVVLETREASLARRMSETFYM
jgi:hypothetical protein